MSKQKQKGTAFETCVVEYLRTQGWPHAIRHPLQGANDVGDVHGVHGVCIEVKNHATLKFSGWLGELDVEMSNAMAETGAVWAKRRGKGSAGEAYVVMTGELYCALLRKAGY